MSRMRNTAMDEELREGTTRISDEEQVIRDWLAGMLSPSGAPLSPSQRRSEPIPRRQVTAVIATLIDLLDEARGSRQ